MPPRSSSSISACRVSFTLIINRNANGLREGGPLLRALRDAAARSTVHETRSLDDLNAAVHAIERDGVRPVIFAGGDGTYSAGVTALWRHLGDKLPPIGLAPCGTVCTVASNWGYAGDAESYIQALFENAARTSPSTIARRSLRVDAEGETRIGFIVGGGLVSSFFEEYYASPPPLGLRRASEIVARLLAGTPLGSELSKRVLTPIAASVDVDGQRSPLSQLSLFVASVVPNLGLHMLLTYRAGSHLHQPGFHVVVSADGPKKLAKQLPAVLAGKPLVGRHIDQIARKVRVELLDRRGFILDGDHLDVASLEVSEGPRLHVLTA